MTEPLPPVTAWPDLAALPSRRLSGGLINDTFVVGEPTRAVLQRQHPMFPAEVNEDIDDITSHVERSGLVTPRLIRTGVGGASHRDGDGRIWRALTWVDGFTVDAVESLAMAAEAGGLVARWHEATRHLEHRFRFSRPGAHDTPAHMASLSSALAEHPRHRLRDAVAPLADAILTGWDAWQGRLEGAPRIAHGDLKISNLRFDDGGAAVCLLDFDTLGMLPLDIELGDAARSWCNPVGEDSAETGFDVDIFEAAFGAYVARSPLSPEDQEAVVSATERICLELASRFAADALNESYFGWNPAVASSRGEHNLLRARGQASLAASARSSRAAMEAVLKR